MTKQYVLIPIEGQPTVLTIQTDDDDELYKLQEAVGGWIEGVPFSQDASLYVNEEGLIDDLPVNMVVSRLAGQMLRGNAVMVGPVDEEGDTGSVPDDLMEFLLNLPLEDQ